MTTKANTPGTSHLQLPCALLLLIPRVAETYEFDLGRDSFAWPVERDSWVGRGNVSVWRMLTETGLHMMGAPPMPP